MRSGSFARREPRPDRARVHLTDSLGEHAGEGLGNAEVVDEPRSEKRRSDRLEQAAGHLHEDGGRPRDVVNVLQHDLSVLEELRGVDGLGILHLKTLRSEGTAGLEPATAAV